MLACYLHLDNHAPISLISSLYHPKKRRGCGCALFTWDLLVTTSAGFRSWYCASKVVREACFPLSESCSAATTSFMDSYCSAMPSNIVLSGDSNEAFVPAGETAPLRVPSARLACRYRICQADTNRWKTKTLLPADTGSALVIPTGRKGRHHVGQGFADQSLVVTKGQQDNIWYRPKFSRSFAVSDKGPNRKTLYRPRLSNWSGIMLHAK